MLIKYHILLSPDHIPAEKGFYSLRLAKLVCWFAKWYFECPKATLVALPDTSKQP